MKGDDLKRWRQDKGLSRKELGDDFGVSEHAVAKWEQGVNPIPKAVQRLVTQLPQLSLTVEQFKRAQAISAEKGTSLEDVLVSLIEKGLESNLPPRG